MSTHRYVLKHMMHPVFGCMRIQHITELVTHCKSVYGHVMKYHAAEWHNASLVKNTDIAPFYYPEACAPGLPPAAQLYHTCQDRTCSRAPLHIHKNSRRTVQFCPLNATTSHTQSSKGLSFLSQQWKSDDVETTVHLWPSCRTGCW